MEESAHPGFPKQICAYNCGSDQSGVSCSFGGPLLLLDRTLNNKRSVCWGFSGLPAWSECTPRGAWCSWTKSAANPLQLEASRHARLARLHRQDAKLETICLALSPIVATEDGRRAWRRLDCIDSPAACRTAPWWSTWFSRCCRGPPASVSRTRMLRTWVSKCLLTQARFQETVHRKARAHTFHEIQGQMLPNLQFRRFIVVTAVRKFIKTFDALMLSTVWSEITIV